MLHTEDPEEDIHLTAPTQPKITTPSKIDRSNIRTNLNKLNLTLDETNPDEDAEPTARWVIRKAKSQKSKKYICKVYDPYGKWKGNIEEERVNILYEKYLAALENPEIVEKHKPGYFEKEIGTLLHRYRTGADKSSGKKVDMKNHWALPDPFIKGLMSMYDITQERFASPLNYNLASKWYWADHTRDAIFGAQYDAYSSKITGSAYMNP